MIVASDDIRHRPTSEDNYSESKWFSFYDETHDFWVSSRIGLEPNRNRANRWLVIALGGRIIYHDLAANLELPREDWDSVTVGGLQFRTFDPMKRYGIKFCSEDIVLDIAWQALTPVFDYEDCLAPLPPSLAAMHYEQSGVVSGEVGVAGRRHRIDGIGHRDHSWGVRHWEGFRSWTAFMGHFGGFYFHIEQFHEDTTGTTRHGFVFADGRNVPVKDARMSPEFSGEDSFPRHFRLQIEDANGHEYGIEGQLRLTCPLNFGSCMVGESYGRFSFKGENNLGIIEYGFTR